MNTPINPRIINASGAGSDTLIGTSPKLSDEGVIVRETLSSIAVSLDITTTDQGTPSVCQSKIARSVESIDNCKESLSTRAYGVVS